jgi:heme/copper-type cytochrome/quinol oxidase subunit 2
MFRAKKLLITVFLLSSVLTPSLVGAANWLDRANQGGLGTIGTQAYGENGAPAKSIQNIVAAIVKIVLGLLGIIFVVLLIVAGFKYMTSGGDEEKIKTAVKGIRDAIIGLIIIICAYSITLFITTYLVNKISSRY